MVMRLVGARVPRVEDRRILTGRGHYIDDLQLPHMVHAMFLRSTLAHARITRLDVSAAREAPGVVAVYTGAEMKALCKPLSTPIAVGAIPEHYPLVTDKVLFVGDLVAMVVAETRYQAEDACELIEVDYDPLPPVVDYETALDPTVPRCSTTSPPTSSTPRPPRPATSMPPSPRPTGSSRPPSPSTGSPLCPWRPGGRWPTTTRARAS
jgi:CO/xanthine dehydrogenase Mo-binding subunit